MITAKATARKANTPTPVIDVPSTVKPDPGAHQVDETSATDLANLADHGTTENSAAPAVAASIAVVKDAHVCAEPNCKTILSGGSPALCPDHMPKVAPTAAPAPVPAPAQTAIAPRPSMQVDVPRDYGQSGFDGDWGADDLKFPQLKQVQGSGPMSEMFDNGTIVFGDVELLPTPSVKEGAVNPSIRFVPIAITKQFREKLSEEAVSAGEMPRIFNSLQEVEDAGLTTRWIGSTMPDNFAEPSARCMFLLEKPEGSDHPAFSAEFGGKQYGVALYYAAGGAFRDSAKIIFNTALTSLLVPVIENGEPKKAPDGRIIKQPLIYKNFWTLNFAKKKAGNFLPWRPIVKVLKEETSAEIRAYCRSLTQSTPEAATAD